MPFSPTARTVYLVDGLSDTREYVPAILIHDAPARHLVDLERAWKPAREQAALALSQAGKDVEHTHWDWANKVGTAESGLHRIVTVECRGMIQGAMAILARPRPARLAPVGEPLLYVDYVEVAPWNLKGQPTRPQFVGVGALLIADAVLLSLEAGWGGRVGLHSLPTAERFYRATCQMTEVSRDPEYLDLFYFEFNEMQATALMTRTGLTR